MLGASSVSFPGRMAAGTMPRCNAPRAIACRLVQVESDRAYQESSLTYSLQPESAKTLILGNASFPLPQLWQPVRDAGSTLLAVNIKKRGRR